MCYITLDHSSGCRLTPSAAQCCKDSGRNASTLSQSQKCKYMCSYKVSSLLCSFHRCNARRGMIVHYFISTTYETHKISFLPEPINIDLTDADGLGLRVLRPYTLNPSPKTSVMGYGFKVKFFLHKTQDSNFCLLQASTRC
jgi:hypothetical protein